MTRTVSLTGFSELEAVLADLSRAAGKSALRRALMSSAEPLARKMRAGAPTSDEPHMAETIDVGTRLTKRQATLHRKMFASDRASVEVFVGPGADPAGVQQEFGNSRHGPQAFARPAWDQDQKLILERLKVDLWDQLSAAVDRAEAKAKKMGNV